MSMTRSEKRVAKALAALLPPANSTKKTSKPLEGLSGCQNIWKEVFPVPGLCSLCLLSWLRVVSPVSAGLAARALLSPVPTGLAARGLSCVCWPCRPWSLLCLDSPVPACLAARALLSSVSAGLAGQPRGISP